MIKIESDINEIIDIDYDYEADPLYSQTYAIDPLVSEANNATITFTATGTEFYKCKDWDFDLGVKSIDNEMNTTSTSRANNRLGDYDFDWGEIEVISEPVPGNNFNNAPSYSQKIVIENNKIYVVWTDYTDYNGAGEDSDIFY